MTDLRRGFDEVEDDELLSRPYKLTLSTISEESVDDGPVPLRTLETGSFVSPELDSGCDEGLAFEPNLGCKSFEVAFDFIG